MSRNAEEARSQPVVPPARGHRARRRRDEARHGVHRALVAARGRAGLAVAVRGRRLPRLEQAARLERRQRLLRVQRAPAGAEHGRVLRVRDDRPRDADVVLRVVPVVVVVRVGVRMGVVVVVVVRGGVRVGVRVLVVVLMLPLAGRRPVDAAVRGARDRSRGVSVARGRARRRRLRARRLAGRRRVVRVVRRRDGERGARVVLRHALDRVRPPDLRLLLVLRLAPLLGDERHAEAPQLLERVVPLLHLRIVRVELAVRLQDKKTRLSGCTLTYGTAENSPKAYKPLLMKFSRQKHDNT